MIRCGQRLCDMLVPYIFAQAWYFIGTEALLLSSAPGDQYPVAGVQLPAWPETARQKWRKWREQEDPDIPRLRRSQTSRLVLTLT